MQCSIHRIFTGLTLFLTVAFASAQNKAANSVQRSMESAVVYGVDLYNNGQYEEAAGVFRNIVEKSPDIDAAWFYLGRIESESQNPDKEAVLELSAKAYNLDPANYWYRVFYAYNLGANEQYAESGQILESLIADYPKKIEPYYNLVGNYLATGEYDKALNVLASVETIFGMSERSASVRYRLLQYLRRPDEAIEYLRSYAEDSSSPWATSVLGDYELSLGRDSVAIAYYDRALISDGSYTPAILGKAEVYLAARNYDEFFPLMKDFVSNEDVAPLMKADCLGNMLNVDPRIFMTNYDRMSELFDLADSLHNDNPMIEWVYCTYLGYSNRLDKLQGLSLECSEKFPNYDMEFFDLRLQASYKLSDTEAVLDTYQRMIVSSNATDSITVFSLTGMADIYMAAGYNKVAYKFYKKALSIDSQYAPALNNYAYFLSLEGKSLAKAASMSRKTVEAEPDNPTYLDTYGWILHLCKKDSDAKIYFKHAMLYGGKDSVVIMDHYAEVLYALGEYDRAFMYWHQALQKQWQSEVPDLEERVEKRRTAAGK